MKQKDVLDKYLQKFDLNEWAKADPLGLIMNKYSGADMEIAALTIAAISWGNRKAIIKAGSKILAQMDSFEGPYAYVMEKKWEAVGDKDCIYRTLNGKVYKEYMKDLYYIYTCHKSIANYLHSWLECETVKSAIFALSYTVCRHLKIGSITGSSPMKRLCMFFRWMVRDCEEWNTCWDKKDLYAILDVHVLKTARKLNLTNKRTVNWKTTEEITERLREMDATDPLKYDFAMFLYDTNSKQ